MFDRNIHEIVSVLQESELYLLVSDSGADRKCGSVGWTLGCPDGGRLAQGWGSVFGYNPQSYRAEISGCRAGLLFLLHSFIYCSVPVPSSDLQVHCDNIGFIQKMEKFREYKLAPTACCLDAEWDLLYATHLLFQYFPVLPSVHHVKGHQDRETPYEELSLVSQMNVDSDRAATLELT